MCLNCLPYFSKCIFCINLRIAAVFISVLVMIVSIFLIVLSKMNSLSLDSKGSIDLNLWFLTTMVLWFFTAVILMFGWSGIVTNEDVRDIMLQVYFWTSVATGAVQLVFCVYLLLQCWKSCLIVALIYLAATLFTFCEVLTCCFCISLRIGMLLISIIAIMTGVISLGVVAQKTNLNYRDINNIRNINDTKAVAEKSSTLVSTGITAFACAFMFAGVLLLFGTIFDSEGLVQGFVWITFVNVITGLSTAIAISVECLVKSSCILSDLDWLSASIVLVLTVAYLLMWIYFVSVANSYVAIVQ